MPHAIVRSLGRAAALLMLVAGMSAVSASAADASLLGTHWRLVSIEGKPADAGRREPYLVLGTDGRIAGNTGCNNFGGGYAVDGASLSFGGVFTTRMYCRTVWEQERAILDSLPLIAHWRVDGDRLELLTAAGIVVAAFEAVPGI